jgi:hypothetical protein
MAKVSKAGRLTADVWCVGVHPVTGRDIEEGTLEAGALIRGIEYYVDDDGSVVATFEASTDGGMTWFPQRGYERLSIE